jgi:hypothetical protein
MNRYDAPPNAVSQCGRILRLLQANAGAWVSLPEILALKISQYGTRIKELRDEWGFTIENRIETVNGARHSWFRLVNEPPAGMPTPTQPEPSRFETTDEPGDWYARRTGKPRLTTEPSSKLPLFPSEAT